MFSDPTGWSSLPAAERRDVIRRTDRGVFSVSVQENLLADDRINHLRGRVNAAQSTAFMSGGVLGPIAPNTDGDRCLDGFADYDGDVENGCEAEADGLDDPAILTERAGSIEATIVPEDDVDVFVLPISESTGLCRGSIAVTIEVPAGIVLQMTVERDDGEVMGQPVVEGEGRATVTVGERCIVDDGDLRVTVRAVGSDRTGERYRLSREGSF